MVTKITIVRKADLQRILESVSSHPKPKVKLEQYVTPSNIVAEILWDAALSNILKNSIIVDLGCGTGRFAIGAAILGAKYVICLDCDVTALATAAYNARFFKVLDVIDFVCSWVPHVYMQGVDIVVQNPPFGVWRKHADIEFLKSALNFKPKVIYSIHKSNPKSRKMIMNYAAKLSYKSRVLFRSFITIPPFLKHHYKWKHKVLIETFKFERISHT